MTELCNTAIKNRREYDHGVDEHLWKMKISSLENFINPHDPYDDFDDDDDDDDSEDEEGDGLSSSRTILIVCPQDEAHSGLEARDYDSDGPHTKRMSSTNKVSRQLLPEGSIIEVTYDYGTTTTLYLKVLSVKEESVTTLLQYFTLEHDHDTMKEMLKSVPAYALPKDQQVDHFFPHASKAFLGY